MSKFKLRINLGIKIAIFVIISVSIIFYLMAQKQAEFSEKLALSAKSTSMKIAVEGKISEVDLLLKSKTMRFTSFLTTNKLGKIWEDGEYSDINNLIAKFISEVPGYSYAFFTDTDGKVKIAKKRDKKNTVIARKFMRKQAPNFSVLDLEKTNAIFVSSDSISNKKLNNTFVFSSPTYNSKKKINGFFIVYFDWNLINKRTDTLSKIISTHGYSGITSFNWSTKTNSMLYSDSSNIEIVPTLESALIQCETAEFITINNQEFFLTSKSLNSPVKYIGGNSDDCFLRMASIIPKSSFLADVKENRKESDKMAIIYITILGIVLFLFIFFKTRPLTKIEKAAQALSNGDFSHELRTRGNDEIGSLSKALNKLTQDLKYIFGNVGNSADSLLSSSNGLLVNSEHLMENATENNSKSDVVSGELEQISSNLSIVSERAIDISDSAKQSENHLSDSVENVEGISEAMTQASEALHDIAKNTERTRLMSENTVKKMTSLDTLAKEINQIISDIAGIADQTNLLALNATIEAARAGEAGKGFAVVASEVKDLAHKSRSATDNIKEVIDQILKSITSSLNDINQMNENITGISSSSVELSVTFEDMSTNTSNVSNGISAVSTNSISVTKDIAELSDLISDISDGAVTISNDMSAIKEANSSIIDGIEEVVVTAEESKNTGDSLVGIVNDFVITK